MADVSYSLWECVNNLFTSEILREYGIWVKFN